MGARCSRTDFEWVYTPEPHASRRKEILAKHPEVKKLMTYDPWMRYIVPLMVCSQVILAYLLRNSGAIPIIIMAYVVGGTINHSLLLAIHEISHNLAFGHSRPLSNRILGIIAGLPVCLPASVTFRKYHLDHHKYQGDDYLDTDIPTRLEVKIFCNTFMKCFWVLLQPLFYAFRPIVVVFKPPTFLEIVNLIVQLIFDVAIIHFMGWRSFIYLLIGAPMSMGFHPIAGHFISEHYVFMKGFETYSYYGALNYLCWNVGYHNEHHDFPNIPGCNLPKLKAMAPEFYDNLPHHDSWVEVIHKYIFDCDLGPAARVKRPTKVKNLSQNGMKKGRPLNTIEEDFTEDDKFD